MNTQIWLVGFMATGKSRTARALAAALDWECIDLDRIIEERAGEPNAQIFRTGGEAAFRALEAQVVEDTAGKSNVVVATGGGAVLLDANRAAMRRHGFVVTLDARPETIAARSQTQMSDRPLLTGDDPFARIVELKAERQALYNQAESSSRPTT